MFLVKYPKSKHGHGIEVIASRVQLVDKSGIAWREFIVKAHHNNQWKDYFYPGRMISFRKRKCSEYPASAKRRMIKTLPLCAFSRAEIAAICIQRRKRRRQYSAEITKQASRVP